jgi:hypothetical protein
MNTGMQDMMNLCWKLAIVMKGQAQPKLLETYSKERIPVIHNVLKKTEATNDAIASKSRVFRSVFNHIAPWLVGMENVQDNAGEHMSQLALNYRESPLSVPGGNSGELRAGDRLPDLPVTLLHSEGSSETQPRPATIFSLLNPSFFTLLYCNLPDPAKTHSEVQGAIEPWIHMMRGLLIATNPGDDRFKKYLGSSPLIILVRPDGYAAFIGSENSIGKLAKFCEKWLLPQTSSSKVETAHPEIVARGGR